MSTLHLIVFVFLKIIYSLSQYEEWGLACYANYVRIKPESSTSVFSSQIRKAAGRILLSTDNDHKYNDNGDNDNEDNYNEDNDNEDNNNKYNDNVDNDNCL